MTSKRNIVIGATLVALLAVLGMGQSLLTKVARAGRERRDGAEVRSRSGLAQAAAERLSARSDDRRGGRRATITSGSFIAPTPTTSRRRRTRAPACAASTGDPIMEFDQAGNLLRHWGGKDGPGYQWPASNHGIWIDYKGNVWIGGNGNGSDGMVLKFTQDGKFLNMFGIKKHGLGPTASRTDRFYQVAKIHVYPKTNEAFVADGYGNKRVAVIDADTGKMKRFWGAYGNTPDDKLDLGAYTPGAPLVEAVPRPRALRRAVQRRHRVRLRSHERPPADVHARRQVRERSAGAAGVEGRRIDVGRGVLEGPGSRNICIVADGRNQKVHIFDRKSMAELTNFGTGGHYPGQWYSLHSIAVDSKGNLYTTETYQGRRVQKFTYKGLAPVTQKDQGTVWPTSTGQ